MLRFIWKETNKKKKAKYIIHFIINNLAATTLFVVHIAKLLLILIDNLVVSTLRVRLIAHIFHEK